MARLRIEQFNFPADGTGYRVTRPDRRTPLVRIVRDEEYRVVEEDGLSDILNLTRAKDRAFGLAETMVWLREEPR
jgi:hypothetical protein